MTDTTTSTEQPSEQDREQLRFAINAFLAEQEDGLISSSRIINPLLTLWSSAHEMGATVGEPIEQLLRALPSRSLVSRSELEETLAEVMDKAGGNREPTPLS